MTNIKSYVIKQGMFKSTLLEAIAMAVHLDIITPIELLQLQNNLTHTTMEDHLNQLIRLNAPSYRAKRKQTETA